MRSGLRNGVVAVLAAVVVVVATFGVAAAVASAPVSGGPAGLGVCATQASSARTARTVAALRAFGDCEIGRRLTVLDRLSGVVSTSKGLTPSDAAALSSKISADRSELAGLKAAIDAQTKLPALRLDVVQIVTRYRVLVLLSPQVRLIVAADSAVALKPHFDDISITLAARIAKAQVNGKDVTAAQTALDAMNAAVVSAVALASPLPAQLLAVTSAGFNSGAAQAALQSARAAILQSRDLLKTAAQDGRKVLAALK
jgi:hypothetical protein